MGESGYVQRHLQRMSIQKRTAYNRVAECHSSYIGMSSVQQLHYERCVQNTEPRSEIRWCDVHWEICARQRSNSRQNVRLRGRNKHARHKKCGLQPTLHRHQRAQRETVTTDAFNWR